MSLGSIKDYTPNYKFIIPEFDIATWHDYIEANFRSIDALLYNIFVINGYSGQWTNSTLYRVNQVLFIGEGNDDFTGKLFKVKVQHTTPSTGNFKTYYTNHPTYYEQFADFDAAERAAQLAKDWANKTNGKVDGIEYSSKYYALQSANSAQQAATTLENAVTLTTNQNITGRKVFVGSYENVKLQLAANTTYTDLAFMNTSNTKLAYIRVKDNKELLLASDGLIKLSHAPTDNTTNSTQIDTVGSRVTACNSLSSSINTLSDSVGDLSSGLNNCMKLTGNQTIDGIKTFSNSIITNIDAVRNVAPNAAKFGGIGIHDNNNNMFASLLGSMDTNKNASVFMRVFNPTTTTATSEDQALLSLHYRANGSTYATAPTPNPNVVGTELITANWILPNYNKATNRSAGVTYTTTKDVRVIIAGTIQNSGDRESMEARVQINGVDKITIYGGYIYGYNEDPFFITFDVRTGVSYKLYKVSGTLTVKQFIEIPFGG